MTSKTVFTAALMAVLGLLCGCAAGPQYAMADREPVPATQPLDLPAWPKAQLIVCPRGEYDPIARCPWGQQFIGYDSAGADALEAYAITAKANTEIAAANAGQLEQLESEAAARNDTAAVLEDELNDERRGRFIERVLVISGALGLVVLAL